MHNYGQGYLVPLCKFTITPTANTELKVVFFLVAGKNVTFTYLWNIFAHVPKSYENSHGYFFSLTADVPVG